MKTIITAIALLALSLPVAAQTTNNSSRTTVDNRAIYVPPIVPFTPPATTGIGNIVTETSACGPLQRVVKTPIEGTFQGFFKSKTFTQGYTYEIDNYLDKDGQVLFYKRMPIPGTNNSFRIVGHQVIMTTTTVGVSSIRNVALGGAGSSGSWGQAGGGGSTSISQLVTNIQLRYCEVGSIERAVASTLPVANTLDAPQVGTK